MHPSIAILRIYLPMFSSLQTSILCLIISRSISETRISILPLRNFSAIFVISFQCKIRGLGIFPNKYFDIFAVSENVKNRTCVRTCAVLAILQIIEKTFFLQNYFSYNREHSISKFFRNEELKKKRISSIRKNPFLNFNNNSVVREIQNTESIQILFCLLVFVNWDMSNRQTESFCPLQIGIF